MDRGRIGTLPSATERDDEAYLDFAESVRAFTVRSLEPALRARATDVLAAHAAATGRPVQPTDDVRPLLDPLPIVAARNRLHRTAQEMMWEGVVATYRKRADELLAELAEADHRGPGTVDYDPNFRYPAYFTQTAFHLQPGGYHGDPLAGYYYHYGTKYLFTGDNDDDQLHRQLVDLIPLPADGVVRRAIDLGCAIGQSATALKKRFPAADVWGIDLAAPMVRYAHKRAVDLGIAVHFAQRAAEDTRYPANAFDIAFAYILFHETPVEVSRQIVAETRRILRPGGVFAVIDMMSAARHTTPLQQFNRAFYRDHNAEPYSVDFVTCDFTGMLRAAGFRAVTERHSAVTMSWLWVAEK
ncbi:MAG: methyltransferase domain-containing protein [Dehalococcoidia bacterium]|nr:methyltransferase domain-containing protein [Dehalococcoidia bacterium]